VSAAHVMRHATEGAVPVAATGTAPASAPPGRGRADLVPAIAGSPPVSPFRDFCRRVMSWARRSVGHNKTRPPPFMGWRGPCATCRTSLASCPACPATTAAPPGPVTRAIYRFPGSSRVPGVSPEWCPFPAVKAFLRPTPAGAQGVEGHLLRVFSLSTEPRQLSATKCGYPPYCSHVSHRTRIVCCSATKRPRGGRLDGRRHARRGRVAGWAGVRLGTIRQGPLHLWDGGGLARRAAPA
jgi:hypothetical protein